MDTKKIFFPDDKNIGDLKDIIKDIGGVAVCYGRIGIHGYLAFNEPCVGVSETDPLCIKLNDFTITINAIQSSVGGNLEGFPRNAWTLGMRQILGSRKIRLYCRNGSPYDLANMVLRLALFGRPGDDYPVTHIRNHPSYQIIIDRETLQTADIIL